MQRERMGERDTHRKIQDKTKLGFGGEGEAP